MPIGLATTTRRVMAYLIDIVLLAIIAVPLLLIISPLPTGPFDTQAEADAAIANYLLVASLLGLVVNAAYFIPQWAIRGSTLGQQWLGVRVANASDGGKPPVGWVVVRWLVLTLAPLSVLSIVLPLIGTALIGWPAILFVTTIMNPRRQGLHDQAARTVVLDRRHDPAPQYR